MLIPGWFKQILTNTICWYTNLLQSMQSYFIIEDAIGIMNFIMGTAQKYQVLRTSSKID